MLNRLNHIAIAVTNLDEGIKIYKDTFGVYVSKKLSCKYTVYHCSDGKSFGVIDNR